MAGVGATPVAPVAAAGSAGPPLGTAPVEALSARKGEAVTPVTEIAEQKPADVVAEVAETKS